MKYVNYLLILLIAFLATSADADPVHGCGGFVEASSGLIKSRTDRKLDYSHITVELQTVDGLVKERTQCAPNGYYFIPVYDKGSFVVKVKGPEGWSWDPEKVAVIIDHKGCNANEDVNFKFTGFALSGKVIGAVGGESCGSKSGGPSGVTVELLSPIGDVVSSVLTSSKGDYSFKNVMPGKYKLRASHNSMEVEVRGLDEVELGFGNAKVDDIFFVQGYEINGLVVAQGNPILGVHIFLYSDDVLKVICPQGSGDAPGPRKALCHAVSDAHGKFAFKSIPCGVYNLVPYYKGESTVFDILPPVVSVSVEHGHVTVPQKFQVTGFSIGGRVVDGNGAGVDGAKLIVDGQERSMTDKNGYYMLDQVTSNHYRIEAQKEHYKFDCLSDVLVLPNMAAIPDIKPVSYDVCGVLQMADAGYQAKVALTHGPENVKPQMKSADANGKFCFEVPAGEYRLSALATAPEGAPELLFMPPHVDVTVRSPILNIEFSQAQVDIHGRVVCKEQCGPSIVITLTRMNKKSNRHAKTIRLTDESGNFMFSDVFPGKYKIEVKHVSTDASSEDDNWCWEQKSIDVNVGTEDVNGILFSQKGYWFKVTASHNVDVRMNQPDGESGNIKIKKGSQLLCIESPGVHNLEFVNSCISFGSSSIKIDTSHPAPIYLKGEKYLLKGQISVDLTATSGLLPESIMVDVFDSTSGVVDHTVARLISSQNGETSASVYEYLIWTNFGQKLTFIPKDSRNHGGKQILFYPSKQEVSIVHDDCQALVPAFSGRLGLYIEGSVSPPLYGVNVKIIADGDSKNVALKKGQLVLETTTNGGGVFVGGPLYDDINYSVEASKPGYHLKATGPYSFSCQKLGQISVRIHSKEDSNEPFPSVLVSLSGDDGYRNNSIAGAGGKFSFDTLFPGSFYLRPLLKEYAFRPSAQAIELGPGESKEVVFEATRVAYSAMGMVTLLSGQPKEGIAIEARSESKGYYEETVTNSSGYYRLRGLHPDVTYTVKVVKRENFGEARIERASPESVAVEVGHEDIKGLDFIVFEVPEKTILSCDVEGTGVGDLDSQLRVEIKSVNDPSRIESVFPLPLSRFFQVKDLPKGRYLLRLRSGLQLSTHKFISEAIEVDLESQAQRHVGPLRYRVEEDIRKQDLAPAPMTPLLVGVSVIILFISMPRLKDLYQAATAGSSSGVKKEVRKPVVRKKTY